MAHIDFVTVRVLTDEQVATAGVHQGGFPVNVVNIVVQTPGGLTISVDVRIFDDKVASVVPDGEPQGHVLGDPIPRSDGIGGSVVIVTVSYGSISLFRSTT
jgi:hypothetical protein